MINDIIETMIMFFEMILQRLNIQVFVDTFSDAVDTAITFLPRIGIVLGYVSYFVNWTLLVPLIIIAGLTFLIRVGASLWNAIAQIT